MFTRIWLWMTGSYVSNALTKYENAKIALEQAVAKEAAVLDAKITKREVAVSMTTDIQASLKAEYERQMAAEAERHANQLDKVNAVIAEKNEAVNKGATLLAQLKGL